MEKYKKFIMKDESGNYAYDLVVYGGDFYKAKIFEGNPKEYERYGNEIIPLDSIRGLELMAREIEILDSKIPETERKIEEMKKGRKEFYKSSGALRRYIQDYNKAIQPLLGLKERTKERLIKDIARDLNFK